MCLGNLTHSSHSKCHPHMMRNYSAPTQFIVNKGPLDILDNSKIFDQLSNQEFHLESLVIMNPAIVLSYNVVSIIPNDHPNPVINITVFKQSTFEFVQTSFMTNRVCMTFQSFISSFESYY